MDKFHGMRWFKCDLHMHTPADSTNWRGAKISDGDKDKQHAADEYIRRCYETGLEVIAITDHNFSSKDFILCLRDSIKKNAEDFGYEITLFPGFEITADIGKGCHALVLFDPALDLETIDHILTECGVPHPRFQNGKGEISTKRLREILEIAQRKDSQGCFQGIVILPHPFDKGIFDNDRISDWLQSEEFTNPDLYCIEIPIPKDQLSEGWKKLLSSQHTCHEEWRRIRPIASVMSSDAKALRPDDGAENYIGFRHSWIKMSRPSIESLRQAFLDQESRIRLQPESPEKDNPHGRIKSLSIRNVAFLKDQDINFSPNLNCLIGGRGTGKSTMLEYMRMAVRQEDEKHSEEQVARIRKTLRQDSLLTLGWRGKECQEDHFEYRSDGGRARCASREITDPATVFKNLEIEIFSQRQLSKIAELDEKSGQPVSLLPLIDRLCGDGLAQLNKQEIELIEKLTYIMQQKRTIERLRQEEMSLKQEAEELGRQWEARVAVQKEAKQHRHAQDADKFLKSIDSDVEATIRQLSELAADITESHSPIGSVVNNWPESAFFEKLDAEIENAKQKLSNDITQAVTTYKNYIQKLTTGNEACIKVKGAIIKIEEDLLAACAKQGLNPRDVEHLREIDAKKRTKDLELKQKQTIIKQLEETVRNFDALMSDLHNTWKTQTEERQRTIMDILSAAGISSVIEIDIKHADAKNHFDGLWDTLAPPDKRITLGRQWESIGNKLFEAFKNRKEQNGSPWEILVSWLSAPDKSLGDLTESISLITEYLNGKMLDAWEKTRLVRIKDTVDLTLYWHDKKKAGSLKELSDGQRNTAVLSLLLAKGTGPVIIDQPEDELDSDFIYNELVPLLRKVKEHRQIILVTHNANLAVNADAELVYALRTEEGHGVKRAEGGLDCEDVNAAVLDIMEGSREAFRKRREKYHF